MTMTIEQAIALIPLWSKASSLTVAPLAGGITNRNYRVAVDGEPFVVRICAAGAELLGIDREREYRCTVTASRTGVAPEVVYFLPDDGIMVTRFVAGRALSAQEPTPPDVVERVIRSIRRYHAGPSFESSFSPFETIDRYLRVAGRAGTPLPEDINTMRTRIREIEVAVRGGRATRPCHNDLWGPNLIDDGAQVRIVDWEYAGMGDACFDLANFAVYHSATERDDEAILRAYYGAVTDDAVTRLALLKIVAELREATWYLAAGIAMSAPTSGFSGFAQTHLDRCRRALADPCLPNWIDRARGE